MVAHATARVMSRQLTSLHFLLATALSAKVNVEVNLTGITDNVTFWMKVLELLELPIKKVPSIRLYPERNRMRRSLRSFWGADIFEGNS